MKAPKKNKVRKQKAKPKSSKAVDKNKKEQVLIVAQEFKFARLLSGNEKKTRDRVLKTLKKWLQNCFEKGYEFKEDDFIRVWKGLFYAVWMSDKPLVQEDLCESIAEILDLFPPEQLPGALLMTKAGLRVLATEWYGIDQHRMDKFLMLVRRYQRGSLRCLRRSGWALPACRAYSDMLMASDGILCNKTPQYARNALSLILHFIDCFLEELAKVSQGEVPVESLAALLRPYTALVCGGQALAACVAARRLLAGLLRQSEPGLRYQEATRAWQKMGCPEGGPEALELVSDDEEDGAAEDLEDERPTALDPRAGRVNVLLPLLPVPATLLAAQLRGLMAQASSKAYKRARICLERFESLARGEYPLAVGEDERAGAEPPGLPEAPAEAARRLHALEKALVADSDELKLRGLKRKHRKRLLRKTRAGLSIVADAPPPPEPSATTANGDWQVEETKSDLEDKSNSEDTSNKENTVAKRSANRKRKVQENHVEKVKKAKSDDSVTDKSKVDIKVVKSKKIVNGNAKKETNVNIKRNEVDKKKIKNLPKLIDETPKRDTATALANKIDNKQSIKNKNKTKLVKEIVVSKTDDKQGMSAKKQGKSLQNDKKLKRQKILPMNKIKNYQKQTSSDKNTQSTRKKALDTPKKVKFVLKNNSMQGTMDYYKSVKQSPNIPFDSSKIPSKTNLKPSMPSPINPFFKKKLRMKF